MTSIALGHYATCRLARILRGCVFAMAAWSADGPWLPANRDFFAQHITILGLTLFLFLFLRRCSLQADHKIPDLSDELNFHYVCPL